MTSYDRATRPRLLHIMLNMDSFPDFLPVARDLADKYLGAARTALASGSLEPELQSFPYDTEAFTSRLDEIYQGLADDVTHYERERGWTHRTSADVIEWMLQMAPFNQTDGA